MKHWENPTARANLKRYVHGFAKKLMIHYSQWDFFVSLRLSAFVDLLSDKFIDVYIYSDLKTEDSENTKSKLGLLLIRTNWKMIS